MRRWIIHPAILLSILGFASQVFNRAIAQDFVTRSPAGLVEVEPAPYVPTQTKGGFDLVPYRERRESWGGYITFSAGNYAPLNYTPDNFVESFDEVYPTTNYSFYEFSYSIKKNFSLGSISLDLGLGMLTLESNKDYEGSKFEFTPMRVGLSLNLDSLMGEPYIVPFVGGGVYSAKYKETYDGAEVGGSTTAAMYFSVGTLIQLNWLDKETSRDAYTDVGIENTFLVAEYRTLVASTSDEDQDYSGSFLNVGFRIEH
jgi:hypothetical protein